MRAQNEAAYKHCGCASFAMTADLTKFHSTVQIFGFGFFCRTNIVDVEDYIS